jgi:hypothetical protein
MRLIQGNTFIIFPELSQDKQFEQAHRPLQINPRFARIDLMVMLTFGQNKKE